MGLIQINLWQEAIHKELEERQQCHKFLNGNKFWEKLFKDISNNYTQYSKAVCTSVFLLFNNTILWLQNNMWSLLYAHPAEWIVAIYHWENCFFGDELPG